MRFLISAIAILLLLAISDYCRGDTWLNSGFASWHSSRVANGDNRGTGVEYTANDWSAMAGSYSNSLGRRSRYAAVGWLPVSLTRWARLGAAGGAVTGYQEDIRPLLLPVLAIDAGPVGVNLTVIPPVEPVTATAVALQFRMRL